MSILLEQELTTVFSPTIVNNAGRIVLPIDSGFAVINAMADGVVSLQRLTQGGDPDGAARVLVDPAAEGGTTSFRLLDAIVLANGDIAIAGYGRPPAPVSGPAFWIYSR